jgi:hypothetical protein
MNAVRDALHNSLTSNVDAAMARADATPDDAIPALMAGIARVIGKGGTTSGARADHRRRHRRAERIRGRHRCRHESSRREGGKRQMSLIRDSLNRSIASNGAAAEGIRRRDAR